jgi:hypothetical protein
MTTGEFLALVRDQASGDVDTNVPWSPGHILMAARWAMRVLAVEAGKASGPHMLYETRMDLKADQEAYQLPDEMVTVKAVAYRQEPEDKPRFFTRIPFAGQEFATSAKSVSPSMAVGAYVYWQTHRHVHLSPRPSNTEAKKLEVWGYMCPPIPDDDAQEILVPWEAERWLIAKTASVLIPPPDRRVAQALIAQLQALTVDLKDWLRKASADVPPSVIMDGLFT